jgi:hypothetical protein
MTQPIRPLDATAPIEAIVAGFEDGTLPFEVWKHHRTHLRVSLWYQLTYPLEEAIPRIREGIQRYNMSKGVVQTPEGGYHETLTRFWIHMIAHHLAGADRRRPFDDLGAELVETLGDKLLPLRYYSRDLIFSWEARTEWREPDLEPLPSV